MNYSGMYAKKYIELSGVGERFSMEFGEGKEDERFHFATMKILIPKMWYIKE